MNSSQVIKKSVAEKQAEVFAEILYDLCVAAATEQETIEASQAEAKAGDTPALNKAIEFICSLDQRIHSLSAYCSINESDILQSSLPILEYIISHHLNALIPLCIAPDDPPRKKHDLLLTSAKSANLIAYERMLGYFHPDKFSLLKAALSQPHTKHSANQKKIVTDLLKMNTADKVFITQENGVDLIRTSLNSINPELIQPLVSLFPNKTLSGGNLLLEFVTKNPPTPETLPTLNNIVKILCDTLVFTANDVFPVLSVLCKHNWNTHSQQTYILVLDLAHTSCANPPNGKEIFINFMQENAINNENKTAIQDTLLFFLTLFRFNATETYEALLLATKLNYAEDAPEVMSTLQSTGICIPEKTLRAEILDILNKNRETQSATLPLQKRPAQMIKALVAAGAKLNPNKKLGKILLDEALLCEDHETLEAILTSSFFFQAQLHETYLGIVTAPIENMNLENKLSKIHVLLKNGLYFTNQTIQSQTIQLILSIRSMTEATCYPADWLDFDKEPSGYGANRIKLAKLSVDVIKTALLTLTTNQLNETLGCFLKDITYSGNRFNLVVFQLLIDTGADPYCRFTDGQSFTSILVEHHNEVLLNRLLQEQQRRGKILSNHDTFYFWPENLYFMHKNDVQLSFYEPASDIFLLATDHINTIKILIQYGFAPQASTIQIFKQRGKTKPKFMEAAAILEVQLKSPKKPELEEPNLAPEEKMMTELGVLRKVKASTKEITAENTMTMSLQYIRKLNGTNILAIALNKILDYDIELQKESKEHKFKHTIDFIIKLKEARFDCTAVFTNSKYLPLLHVLSNAKQEHHGIYRDAARLLLTFVPFLQLMALKKDEMIYKELTLKLPKELKSYINSEFDKPRADLTDLVFYMKSRSENPDNQFDKRAPIFNTIMRDIQDRPDHTQDIIKHRINDTRPLLIGTGQTTRILQAMQTELTLPQSSLSYANRLRFSYTLAGTTDPTIQHAYDAVMQVYENRKGNN